MKILQIAGSGAIGTAHAGPVSNTITQLANALAAAGHTVGVADAPASEVRARLHPAVEVHEILPSRRSASRLLPGPLGSIAGALPDFQCLRRHFRNGDHDVVHVHDGGQALIGGLFHRSKVLWTSHGMNWTMKPGGKNIQPGPGALIERRLDLLACRVVDHMVVLNRQTLDALDAQNVSMIPNGIHLHEWPSINRRDARARLGIAEKDFLVTYVGRVAPVKGVDVYVKAVEKAARQISLHADAIGSLSGVFGTSTQITEYAERVGSMGSTVTFRGFIHRDNPEYRMRLAAADAVVVPSHTEPFGLVVLEALACGARVVGSDVGGIRDMLADGRGILVPPGDADALGSVIVDLHSRNDCAKRSRGCRADLSEYDWNNVAEQYCRVMNSLSLQGQPS